jgi:hypothetical protein
MVPTKPDTIREIRGDSEEVVSAAETE